VKFLGMLIAFWGEIFSSTLQKTHFIVATQKNLATLAQWHLWWHFSTMTLVMHKLVYQFTSMHT